MEYFFLSHAPKNLHLVPKCNVCSVSCSIYVGWEAKHAQKINIHLVPKCTMQSVAQSLLVGKLNLHFLFCEFPVISPLCAEALHDPRSHPLAPSILNLPNDQKRGGGRG